MAALVLLIVSALTVSVCAALQAQQQRMSEKIIRLHVVANSDSSADQAIELHVRDAVLSEARQALQGTDDPQQAIAQALPQLEAAANAALAAQGSRDTASVSVRRELFPTREYDTFFPCPPASTGHCASPSARAAGATGGALFSQSLCVPATADGFVQAAEAGGFTRAEIGAHDAGRRGVCAEVPVAGASAGAQKGAVRRIAYFTPASAFGIEPGQTLCC